MSAYVLFIFLYGGLSNSDSVALSQAPMATLEACETAGKEAITKLAKGFKSGRYVCVATGAK